MKTKHFTTILARGVGALIISLILLHNNSKALAQSTWQEVYTIFQSVGSIDSLDFTALTMADAYNNIFDQPAANTFAQSKGYKRIDPGDPHRSFLFRKINNGLDQDIILDPVEGANVGTLTDNKKELVRQWILFGAPQTGEVVDTVLISDYYSGNGIASIPDPPAAPCKAEGFQIHFGPYFIAPGNEKEYFLKFDPHLADSIEIYRTDVFMGDNFSHHFILYRITDDNPQTPEGLRPGHTIAPVTFVSGAQFSNTVLFPAGTAIKWPQSALLDINSHHINFSPKVLACEVYINIYTQPAGTAKQIMNTSLILGATDYTVPFVSNGLIISNDGNSYTYTDSLVPQSLGSNDIFVWLMTSHTHQWGVDFDIYKRNIDGSQGLQYFDASNLYGHPDSAFIGYDYDRPPTRIFEPFLFVPKNEGLIQVASWVNNGPNNPVTWGYTSEDEMMIMVISYVTDTTGLSILTNAAPIATDDAAATDSAVAVVIDVQANDNEPDGDLLITSIYSGPNNGTATIINCDSINYINNAGFTGTDTLWYMVCDQGALQLCDTAMLVITVTASIVGIDNIGQNLHYIRIFPNPFTDKAIIILPHGEMPFTTFTLYDVFGKLVKRIDHIKTNQIIIQRSNLSSGVYFYQVSGKNNILARGKLVLN